MLALASLGCLQSQANQRSEKGEERKKKNAELYKLITIDISTHFALALYIIIIILFYFK